MASKVFTEAPKGMTLEDLRKKILEVTTNNLCVGPVLLDAKTKAPISFLVSYSDSDKVTPQRIKAIPYVANYKNLTAVGTADATPTAHDPPKREVRAAAIRPQGESAVVFMV